MPSQLSDPVPDRFLLKARAYGEIKERIQNDHFPPGSFLSERQLTGLLGMSKTPIKAALERLELEGFVSISPQQGVVVRQVSLKEVADQFELRKALEGHIVKAIAGKLTDKQVTSIQRNLRQQQTAAGKSDVPRFVELDAKFHLLLCEVFGNQAMLDCLAQHRSKMHRVISQVLTQASGRFEVAFQEHTAMFDAIEQGKTAAAVRLVEQHLEFGKQFLLSSGWA